MSTTQISAYISADTKNQLEAYVKRRGVKKAFLIEEALLHYMQALRDIPEDIIISSRLVLTEESMVHLASQMDNNQEPSSALRELFSDSTNG